MDPVFENTCKAAGIEVIGKEVFTLLGEYTPTMIRKAVLGKDPEETLVQEKEVPARPPVLCAGCPHRATFSVLHKLGLMVSGDIGCYTLGALAPLNAMDTTICMGASISAAHGMNTVRGKDFAKKLVSVIGDSTFMHSGMTGLSDMVYNKSTGTVIILDNSITGMTGHQDNPTTGKTIRGEETKQANLVTVCKGLGVEHVCVEDPFNLKAFEQIVREETEREELSVIIAQHPCALLKNVKVKPALAIGDKCKKCKKCMSIGCPAISAGKDGSVKIDPTQCNGCGLCGSVCPFDAIGEPGKEEA